jgi:hypothetical protein
MLDLRKALPKILISEIRQLKAWGPHIPLHVLSRNAVLHLRMLLLMGSAQAVNGATFYPKFAVRNTVKRGTVLAIPGWGHAQRTSAFLAAVTTTSM